MNPQQLQALLASSNPHWSSGVVAPIDLTYQRDVLPIIARELDNHPLIIALTGSRRVGKSYLLKQLMHRLLSTDRVPQTNILYLSFGTQLSDPDILAAALELYVRVFRNPKYRAYIFLDEVQYVPYWQDQIKKMYDQQLNLKIVVTGSSSLFYRQPSKESLAGRIIKKRLRPLSFGEYLRFADIAPLPSPWPLGTVPTRAYAQFVADLPLYRIEFTRYLARGSFPELVRFPGLSASEYMTNFIDQVVNYDMAVLFPKINRTIVFQIIQLLSLSISQEYSMHALATRFGVGRGEVGDYVRALEELGIFQTCNNGYFRKQRAILSASKKLYTFNSTLAITINGFDERYLADSRIFGQYVENYVFTRLVDRYTRLVYYREPGASREIDFITDTDAFEVKAGVVGNITRYEQIAQKIKRRLILLTEGDWAVRGDGVYVPWYLL